MEHRILIVARHTLFARGIESLLSGSADMHLVGTINSTEHLLGAVDALHPDCVIVEGDACDTISLIGSFPRLRVVAVTMDASTIDVIDSKHIARAGAADLLAAVGGPPRPNGVIEV